VVAWHLGARYSNRVDRLAVINAPHPAAFTREMMTPDQFARSLYVLFFQVPLLSEAAARLLVRRSLRETAAPGTFSAEALDVYENGISQPGAATAMLNYYRAAYRQARRNISRADKLIERPTLVLWGMEDFALSPGLLDGLDRWVPNLRVERVEGCGHWLPEERPALTADVLLDFLS
jgi:pimeloyl-ACP methyl ester carboxylesterase